MESRSSSPELQEEEIQEEEYQETKEEESQKGFKSSITKNQAGGKTYAKDLPCPGKPYLSYATKNMPTK